MKVLVLGSKGQLGRCLCDQLGVTQHEVIYTSRAEIDIADLVTTKKKITDIKPNVVINASAYSAVDKAEEDRQTADLINHLAVANIANTCKYLDCWLIHISTDYVFDGAANKPYSEDDGTNPQSVYGCSKLNGELAICSSGCQYLIIRTAWVFSEYGNNFLKTMLLLGTDHDELSIIGDQIGCPTYGPDLAKAIICTLPFLELFQQNEIYHYAGNSSCSWAELAQSIFDEAERVKILNNKPNIVMITSEEYPTMAKRPINSQLDSSKFEAKFEHKASDWKLGIRASFRSLYNPIDIKK
jgi:dTDP-4-dehydrorhamnose reductase